MSQQDCEQCESTDESKEVVKPEPEWTGDATELRDTVQPERGHCQLPGKPRQNEAIQQPLEPSAGVAAVTVNQNSTNPVVIPGSNPSDKSPNNPLPSSTSPAGGVPFPLSLLHQEEFAVTSTKHAIATEENNTSNSATRHLAASQRYGAVAGCLNDSPSPYAQSNELQRSVGVIDSYRESKEPDYALFNHQNSKIPPGHGYQSQWEPNGKGKLGNDVSSLSFADQKQNSVSVEGDNNRNRYTSVDSKPSPYSVKHTDEAVIKHRNHYPKDRTYDYLRRTESQRKLLESKNDLHNLYKTCGQKSAYNIECHTTSSYAYSKHDFTNRTSYTSAHHNTVEGNGTSLPNRTYPLHNSKADSQPTCVPPEKTFIKDLTTEHKPEYFDTSHIRNGNSTTDRVGEPIPDSNHSKYTSRHTTGSHDKWVDTPYCVQPTPKKDLYPNSCYPLPAQDKKCQDNKTPTIKDNPYGYNKWNYDYSYDNKSRQSGAVVNSVQDHSTKNLGDYTKQQQQQQHQSQQDKPFANWYNSTYFYPKGYTTDHSSSSKSNKSYPRAVQPQTVPKQQKNDPPEREPKPYLNGPTSGRSYQNIAAPTPEKSYGSSSSSSLTERSLYPNVTSSSSSTSYHGLYNDTLAVSKPSVCSVPTTSTFYPVSTVSYPADVPAYSTIYSNSRDSLKVSWSSAASKSSTAIASSNVYATENVEASTRGRHSSHSSNGSSSSLSQLSQTYLGPSHPSETGGSAFLSLAAAKEQSQERASSRNSSRSRSNSRSATSPAVGPGTNCTPTSSSSPNTSSSYETTGSLTSLVFSKHSSWSVPSSSSFATPQILSSTSSSSSHRSSSPLSTTVGSSSLTSPSTSLASVHPGSALFGLSQAPGQPSFLSGGGSQVMFGPSLVPTASYLQAGPTGPTVFGGESLFVPPNQDLLRRELDTRFLASHDRSIHIPPPPYMRTEMHQHQHQHTHMHQHSPFLPPPLGAPLMPQSAAHLYDKFPKLDAGFYGRSSLGLPGYPGLSPFLSPSAAAAVGATPFVPPGNLAAFQPKASSLMKTKQVKPGRWCAMHVRIAWEIYRHQLKQQSSDKGAGASSTSFSTTSKSPAELLHPSNPLFTSIPKPHDLAFSSSLFGAANRLSSIPPRSPYDVASPHNSFLSPTAAHLSVPPLPRPAYAGFAPPGAAFGGLSSLGLGGASLFGGKDVGPSVLPGVQDPWSRLHRTPPTFPSPSASSNSSWGGLKAEAERERERLQQKEDQEKERQKKAEKERREKEMEKSKEIARDKREQEKQKERDRESRMYHLSNSAHFVHNGEYPDRNREREKIWDPPHDKRERSRSPVRVPSGQRMDSAFDPSNSLSKSKHDIRVKEERKDGGQNDLNNTTDMRRDIVMNCSSDRTKSFEVQKNPILNSSDSSRAVSSSAISAASTVTTSAVGSSTTVSAGCVSTPDRLPMSNFWGPMPTAPLLALNASSLAMSEHYRNFELHQLREMDREQLMQKYGQLPAGVHTPPDRLREVELARQSAQAYEAAARDAERQSLVERDRQMLYDRSKLPPPPLRTDMTFVPPIGVPPTSNSSGLFPFSNSFLNNFCSASLPPSNKTASPTSVGNGIPPPLIPCGPSGSPNGVTAAAAQNHTGGQTVVHNASPPAPVGSSVPLPQPPTPSHLKPGTAVVSSDRESPRDPCPSKDKYEVPVQGRETESQSR